MTIEHMRTFLTLTVVIGCNGQEILTDAPPPTLDCETYCDRIQQNCLGENAQFPDRDHCMATCASFAVEGSTVVEEPGNTLGCRIYHAGIPSKTPATDCAKAGPGGDQLSASPPAACSGGNVCTSFCALQIEACGSLEAPLPGDPRDTNGNPLFQYRNIERCVASCATFDKTHAYSTTSAGDSLACRLRHATSAALSVTNAMTECAYTGGPATGPCDGTPTP